MQTEKTRISSAFELKGSLLTLMVLQLIEADVNKIAEQLEEKVKKVPQFFENAPIVIDLHAVQTQEFDLAAIVQLLRQANFIPVGVRGGSDVQNKLANQLSLGLLPNTKSERHIVSRTPRHKPADKTIKEQITEVAPTKVITRPVRSGQQIVALEGDLIILASVSHGAELLAKGCIHVYGALRGRALAGVKGDTQARIFCQRLDAELVSIAGQYVVNETFPDDLREKAVQIYLEEENLKFESLNR